MEDAHPEKYVYHLFTPHLCTSKLQEYKDIGYFVIIMMIYAHFNISCIHLFPHFEECYSVNCMFIFVSQWKISHSTISLNI